MEHGAWNTVPTIERLGAADSALVATVGPLMVLPGARTGIAGIVPIRINLCPTDAADRDGAHAAIINALTQIAAQPWRRDGGRNHARPRVGLQLSPPRPASIPLSGETFSPPKLDLSRTKRSC